MRVGARLEIDEFDFTNPELEAAYTEYPTPAGMAIRRDLPAPARRAREIEAHGYYRRPPRGGRKLCYACRSLEDLDYVAVEAIRSVIDDLQPSWVEEVKEAARMSNDPRWIAAWVEVSVQVVVAILLNLEARGQLAEG